MQQIGAAPQNRLAALEETVQAVRALLRGEKVTSAGAYVNLDQVELERPPKVAPSVLIGSTGPMGLQLAGTVAGGALLAEGCGPAFARWAVDQMSARDERLGVPGGRPRCVLYSWLALDDSPERALSWVRPTLEEWAASPHYPYPRALAGLQAPPADGAPSATPRLDGDALTQLARSTTICGDAAICADAVGALQDAGADEIMLVVQGPEELSQLEAFVNRVVPLLEKL